MKEPVNQKYNVCKHVKLMVYAQKNTGDRILLQGSVFFCNLEKELFHEPFNQSIMLNKTHPPVIDLPHSIVDRRFKEDILWSYGLAIQARVGPIQLCRFRGVETLPEVAEIMWGIINQGFLDGHIHWILGPITPKNGRSIEENLLHFLWAYDYHVSKHGRKVFPQFLFSPIVSNIAGRRIKDGEDPNVVHSDILVYVYQEIFDRLKDHYTDQKGAVNGWFLEGFQDSEGALWE